MRRNCFCRFCSSVRAGVGIFVRMGEQHSYQYFPNDQGLFKNNYAIQTRSQTKAEVQALMPTNYPQNQNQLWVQSNQQYGQTYATEQATVAPYQYQAQQTTVVSQVPQLNQNQQQVNQNQQQLNQNQQQLNQNQQQQNQGQQQQIDQQQQQINQQPQQINQQPQQQLTKQTAEVETQTDIRRFFNLQLPTVPEGNTLETQHIKLTFVRDMMALYGNGQVRVQGDTMYVYY